MDEPIYGAATERVYGRLPAHFHDSDPRTNYTTKRFLSGLLARQDEIVELLRRFEYISPEEGAGSRTSELVHPLLTDEKWIPWLSQLFGVKNIRATGLTADGEVAYNVGSFEAIAAAARTALVGDKFVKLIARQNGMSPGTVWDLTMITRNSETLQNLLPEFIAAVNSPGVLDVVMRGEGGSLPKVLNYGTVRSASTVPDKEFYNGKVMRVQDTSGEMIHFEVSTPAYSSPVESGDPLNFMVSVKSDPGTFVLVAAEFTGPPPGTGPFPDLPTTRTGTKVVYGTGKKVSVFIPMVALDNPISVRMIVSSANAFSVGEFGLRIEPVEGWLPRTANPVQAVIDAGAKPAGVILHHRLYTPTWDTLEATRPNWDSWELAGSWNNIEESGL